LLSKLFDLIRSVFTSTDAAQSAPQQSSAPPAVSNDEPETPKVFRASGFLSYTAMARSDFPYILQSMSEMVAAGALVPGEGGLALEASLMGLQLALVSPGSSDVTDTLAYFRMFKLNGQNIGFVRIHYYFHEPYFELHTVFISAEHRHKGHAQTMCSWSIDEMRPVVGPRQVMMRVMGRMRRGARPGVKPGAKLARSLGLKPSGRPYPNSSGGLTAKYLSDIN
jgi:hypothetical protein